MDETSRDGFAATRHLITPEYQQLRRAAVRGYRDQLRAAREARMTAKERAATAALAADRAQQAERVQEAIKEFNDAREAVTDNSEVNGN